MSETWLSLQSLEELKILIDRRIVELREQIAEKDKHIAELEEQLASAKKIGRAAGQLLQDQLQEIEDLKRYRNSADGFGAMGKK